MIKDHFEWFICGDCGKKHGRPKGPGKKPQRCPECREIWEREYNTNWSRKNRGKPLYKSFTCEVCGNKYKCASERQRRVCNHCKRAGYNEKIRIYNNEKKGKALIGIVNISKRLRKTGSHLYALKINSEVICKFKHNREDPLSVILEKAAAAAREEELKIFGRREKK